MPASDDRFDLGIARDGGLTHVLDKGLGPRRWDDVRETGGESMDTGRLGGGPAWVPENLNGSSRCCATSRSSSAARSSRSSTPATSSTTTSAGSSGTI